MRQLCVFLRNLAVVVPAVARLEERGSRRHCEPPVQKDVLTGCVGRAMFVPIMTRTALDGNIAVAAPRSGELHGD